MRETCHALCGKSPPGQLPVLAHRPHLAAVGARSWNWQRRRPDSREGLGRVRSFPLAIGFGRLRALPKDLAG